MILLFVIVAMFLVIFFFAFQTYLMCRGAYLLSLTELEVLQHRLKINTCHSHYLLYSSTLSLSTQLVFSISMLLSSCTQHWLVLFAICMLHYLFSNYLQSLHTLMMPGIRLNTYRIHQVFSSFWKLIVVVSFSFELFWCYGISHFSFESFFHSILCYIFLVGKGKCPTLNVICCGWAKHDTEKCETSSENGKWTLAFSKRKKSFFLIHASAASGLLQCPLNLSKHCAPFCPSL